MTHGLKGKFVVIDGLDGIGKGVASVAIIDYLKSRGLRVLNLDEFWKAHKMHPELSISMDDFFVPLDSFDVLLSSEPTFTSVGFIIRKELIAKNDRFYSASATADAYSLDRLILYKRVILPALKAGKIVIQSRSVSSSLIYQPIQSDGKLTMQDIAKLEGNAFCLDNAPDLLIITTIGDANEIMKRLSEREKKDNCVFENLDFQLKIKPVFESEELKELFESKGTKVNYLDAGVSVESTKKQAVNFYKNFFKD